MNSLLELRSVNLDLDIDKPEIFVDFVPTQKSIKIAGGILDALTGKSSERAINLSAPYGSGKSALAATVISAFSDSEVANILQKKLFNQVVDSKVFTISISGRQKSVIPAITEAIKKSLIRHNLSKVEFLLEENVEDLDGLIRYYRNVRKSLKNRKYQGVVVFWDEFGKILEHAAGSGNSNELYVIQTLAEEFNRSGIGLNSVLVLINHQSFVRYSASLPSYIRNEWTKIEGRFKSVNYIETSGEVYDILGTLFAGENSDEMTIVDKKSIAHACIENNLFEGYSSEQVVDLCGKTKGGINIVGLWILPLLSAKVSQNERTLFTFHKDSKTSGEFVTFRKIYEYFEDSMRQDIAVGGAHRKWVATQAALRKVEGESELQLVVKTISLIQLVQGTTRVKALEDVVQIACDMKQSEFNKCIRKLLKQRVIHQNRITKELSIWQGADVDLLSALEDNKLKLKDQFDLKGFLNKTFPISYQIPRRYNCNYMMTRYYSASFVDYSDVEDLSASINSYKEKLVDGHIFYFISESEDETSKAEKAFCKLKENQIVLCVPGKTASLRESCIEYQAYQQLSGDPNFCANDPFLADEITSILDELYRFIKKSLTVTLVPQEEGHKFFHMQKKVACTSLSEFQSYLSDVTQKIFPHAPIMNNEMINRNKVSGNIVNARKKIVRHMIDHLGKRDMSLGGYGPDYTIFRALLLNTGLYANISGDYWELSLDKLKKSSNFQKVSDLLAEFWTTPGKKSIRELVRNLQKPPYGMRTGYLPILLAASFFGTNSNKNVVEKGLYVYEFDSNTFDNMRRTPDNFNIDILETSSDQMDVLQAFSQTFCNKKVSDYGNNVIKQLTIDFMKWYGRLPDITRGSSSVSKESKLFRTKIMKAGDPMLLFTKDIPEVLEAPKAAELKKALKRIKLELNSFESKVLNQVKETLEERFARLSGKILPLQDNAREWINMLPDTINEKLISHKSKGVVVRTGSTYETEDQYINSIASLITGTSIRFWKDSDAANFEMELNNTLQNIEDVADTLDLEDLKYKRIMNIGSSSVGRKLEQQIGKMSEYLGEDKVKSYLQDILSKL